MDSLQQWAKGTITMAGIRAYTNADAAACCTLVNAAIDEMDGLNDAAREFIRTKNTPEQ